MDDEFNEWITELHQAAKLLMMSWIVDIDVEMFRTAFDEGLGPVTFLRENWD